MDKDFQKKKKSKGEWTYFLGNVFVGVRVVSLPNYPLVLSFVFFLQDKNSNEALSWKLEL